MITENDVLLILHNDTWFAPSQSDIKKKIVDENGNQIEVAESYYHTSNDGSQIIIRVSNHGTSLNTWVKRRNDPSKSLQNLSVVFSNGPVSSEVKTEPIKMQDENGNTVQRYLYFVVEQYAYRMDRISKADFLKFIEIVKSLDSNNVFQDPFKKKPSKKAARTVLIPKTIDGGDVPPSNNPIHPRQDAVVRNRKHEIDAEGNIVKDSRERWMGHVISEVINQYLKDNLVYESKKKGLSDDEINCKLTHLVSNLHLKGKLSQKEADTILFYGFYRI